MARLIGIQGKSGSGKDTLGLMLVELGFRRMAFADPLKSSAVEIFGIPRESFYDPELKELNHPYWAMTPRHMLQQLGTEAVRVTFGRDHWVRRWEIEYAKLMDDHDVVLTDVREEHEAAAVRAQGGLVIHLKRDGAGLAGDAGNHSSERGIELHAKDLVVLNNGTLLDLLREAKQVLAYMGQYGDQIGYSK